MKAFQGCSNRKFDYYVLLQRKMSPQKSFIDAMFIILLVTVMGSPAMGLSTVIMLPLTFYEMLHLKIFLFARYSAPFF